MRCFRMPVRNQSAARRPASGAQPISGMAKKSEHKRRPLLQRAALHALRTLVREYPPAALSAAGAGAGYAVKSVAKDGSRRIKASVKKAETAVFSAISPSSVREVDDGERQQILDSMTRRERKALAKFARCHGNDSKPRSSSA